MGLKMKEERAWWRTSC